MHVKWEFAFIALKKCLWLQMFMYYGVTCWHSPEEDSQPPKTNSLIDFNREELGSCMVQILNSHSSGYRHSFSTYIDIIFLELANLMSSFWESCFSSLWLSCDLNICPVKHFAQ